MNCLNLTEIKNRLEYLKSQITSDNISMDEIVSKLQKHVLKFPIRLSLRFHLLNQKLEKRHKPQEWFDNDCKMLKKDVNKKCKLYQKALREKLPENETKLRKDGFFDTLNDFSKLKRNRVRVSWQQKRMH